LDFYWSLAEYEPRAGRALLLERSYEDWREAIFHDLERMHPNIRDCVSRMDIMRMGHAMIRPSVGFIHGHERMLLAWVAAEHPPKSVAGDIHALRQKLGSGLFFANSDVSGISIFEEAQYRGVMAAKAAAKS